MLSFLTSSATTVLLFLAMAVYLLRGKYSDGTLFPQVLIGFACVILAQGGLALAVRLARLRSGASQRAPRRGKGSEWVPLEISYCAASALLRSQGFAAGGGEEGEGICYARRVRASLICECVAYAALLVTLTLGLLNYGFSISGSFMLSPEGEWAGLRQNVRMLQRGFMADISALEYRVKGTDLTPATSGAPSRIRVAARDARGRETASPPLQRGDTYDLGRVRMVYLGDSYLMSLLVTKGDHDYLARPVHLKPGKRGGRAGYLGALVMSEPGARGTVLFDPEARRLALQVVRNGKVEYDSDFALQDGGRPSEGTRGDFRISLTSYGHYGSFNIMRHTYRNEIFAGLGILLLAVTARGVVRPRRVWLRQEGERCLCRTAHRGVRQRLAAQRRG